MTRASRTASPVRHHRGGARGHPRRAAWSSSATTRTARTRATSRWPPSSPRPEAINFMAKEGRGLDLPGAHARALRRARPRPHGGQERVALRDAVHGLHRGPRGRHDRASRPPTARTRSRSPSTPRARRATSSSPGHVFPLKAKAGGVLERTGQTEAAVDLARLAGLNPAGVICEIMNDDGTMARVDDLVGYCERHGLKMITVADLIAYRRRHDKLVERVVATRLPTGFGDFDAVGYRSLVDDKHHVALVKGDVDGRERRARARALRVPDRRRLPLAALRLRRAARVGAGDDRARGPGRAALPRPGGPRHRPAEQAARLQAAGGGAGHRRGQPPARAAGRPARLRHRRADPRRPRADARSGSSRTTRRRSAAWRATGCRSPSRSRSSTCPTRTTRPTCAPSASAWATRCTTRASTSTRRCCGRGARERGAPTRRRRPRPWSGGAALRDRRRRASTTELAERLVARCARGASRRRARASVDVFDVPGAFELPLAAKLAARVRPLRRRRLPRRGHPRRDRPLRLRLRRGRARHPGRAAAHRRARAASAC